MGGYTRLRCIDRIFQLGQCLIVRIVIRDGSRYLRCLAAYRNVELIHALAYNGMVYFRQKCSTVRLRSRDRIHVKFISFARSSGQCSCGNLLAIR
ncbi:hypothetical protein D3C81_1312860 [compost metagenome]